MQFVFNVQFWVSTGYVQPTKNAKAILNTNNQTIYHSLASEGSMIWVKERESMYVLENSPTVITLQQVTIPQS